MNAHDVLDYATIIVAFSGGKDSVACVLHLLELGVPRERIELWHHEVDGREGSTLMDWPCTPAYCRAFAAAFGLPIYFSWKAGGFEREMLRDGERTAPTMFECPDGSTRTVGGTRGKLGTRRKFPQVSPDLSVRWCSAYLKIDVCSAALRAQDRFNRSRTLVVTGERAEESAARSRYKTFEPDRADLRDGGKARHVDRWRPVHGWSEAEVWAIMERHKVRPHPAYELGWGRVSCMRCIFGSADQFATARAVDPKGFEAVARHEDAFGVTIKRKTALRVLADKGTPYSTVTPARVALAMSTSYTVPIITDAWALPAGAFGESTGPT